MKAFFDSEYADRLDFEMRRQPQHIWRERAGLFLSNVDAKMTGREEAFTSSWAGRMPVFGAVVRGSNRHMVTMLNQMRVAAFDSFREANLDADTEVMTAMARYHEELARAGVLLDASGLQPSAKGWRVGYSASGTRTVTDGPFTETKELIAGYTLIQVRSRDEALEWTRRFPNPRGEGLEAEIEVRQL